MQGPYDSRGKKVNEVNMYDVFGRHREKPDLLKWLDEVTKVSENYVQ
jgi:hypothetical protein